MEVGTQLTRQEFEAARCWKQAGIVTGWALEAGSNWNRMGTGSSYWLYSYVSLLSNTKAVHKMQNQPQCKVDVDMEWPSPCLPLPCGSFICAPSACCPPFMSCH